MYHTPNLTGFRKLLIPKRINEGWGLQHMKIYGVDDEVILSGANLSEDYFTNRQDRYWVFRSKEVETWFRNVHQSVCRLSFLMTVPEGEKYAERAKEAENMETGKSKGKTVPKYNLIWPESNAAVSPLEYPRTFKKQATAHLKPLLQPSLPKLPPSNSSSRTLQSRKTTTTIYPLLQLTPLLHPDTSTELPTLLSLLRHIRSNPSRIVTEVLLSTNPVRGEVITAHPHANGFYGSKGVSGMLPGAYTALAAKFLGNVKNKGLKGQVKLSEWKRGIGLGADNGENKGEEKGWTYHAKGIWITLPDKASASEATSNPMSDSAHKATAESDSSFSDTEPGPQITLLGSSNYTQRSYTLDLEANVLVLTDDPALRDRMKQEETWLKEYVKPVTMETFENEDRKVSWKVRIAMAIVKLVGGAL
jgi:CDP-diacylglycerol---glycerol-3-phosphate 3-phosphatidyltransferase